MSQYIPEEEFDDELDAITQMMQGVVYVGQDDSYSTPITWTIYAQQVAKEFCFGS